MAGLGDVWGQRYRVVFRDNDKDTPDDLDWYLLLDGCFDPVGMFRTKEAAEMFKKDRIDWEGKGCPPESRPASNDQKYM